MEPIITNSHLFQNNFLQDLPTETLGEICSFLSIQHLGNLSSLSKTFATVKLNDVMWKNLDPNSIPQAYQKLPGSILKARLKKDHAALKAKVDLVLENADLIVDFTPKMPLFSKELVAHLKNKDVSLKDKYVAIKEDLNLVDWFYHLYYAVDYAHLLNLSKKPFLEAFELVLQLVDVNKAPINEQYPLLFHVVVKGDIKLAKKLIDAGADFDLCNKDGISTYEYVEAHFATANKVFPQEIVDEIAAYAAQKKADSD